MSYQQDERLSRREFLSGLTLAATVGLLGLRSDSVVAEPPPETTAVRLAHPPSLCQVPQFLAEEFLRAEGFTEVKYVKVEQTIVGLASGEVDISMTFVGPTIIRVEAGEPLVILAPGHVGCFGLFGTDRVRAIRDLKGKAVSVHEFGASQHVFLSAMAAYVGLDPRKDINWVKHRPAEAARLLAEGKIDAFMTFPPFVQELRAKKVGHVVVDGNLDRPWSQYFCCMVTGNREFVRKHPVATKRVIRAFLRAADVCALMPEQIAQSVVDKGFTKQYEYALQMLKEMPYSKWREYHPEDTVRFYALRLHEAGMIKSSPQKIIAGGTDWRLFNELRKELKP